MRDAPPIGRRQAMLALLASLPAWHGFGAHASDAGRGLHFGLIVTEARSEIEAKWQPLLELLGKSLGYAVKPHVSSDYAGAVWALRNGRTQLAWLGNKAALEAIEHAGAEVFAQKRYPSGLGGYHSLLVVSAGSSLMTVDDLLDHAAGLTLAMGDPNSTSGTLVPNHYLFAVRGVDPRRWFKRVTQGSHEENILALLEGRADAAVVASIHLENLRHRLEGLDSRLRVVWTSPLIPADPLVWRSTLPEDLKVRIRRFFVGLGGAAPEKSSDVIAAERAALKRLDLTGFVASDNSQLAMVLQLDLAQRRLAEVESAAQSADRRGRP